MIFSNKNYKCNIKYLFILDSRTIDCPEKFFEIPGHNVQNQYSSG